MKTQASVSNGIVFVLDPKNKTTTVPTYDPAAVVVSSDSCVSIKTIPEVDGDVSIRLSGSSEAPQPSVALKSVFQGSVSTPNRSIAVVTAEFTRLLEMPVGSDSTAITIHVDDPDFPSEIEIRVS